jgi:hypothetical protein
MTNVIQGEPMLFTEYIKQYHPDVKLNPFQETFVEELNSSANILFLKSRQIGMSFILKLYTLYEAEYNNKPVHHITTRRDSFQKYNISKDKAHNIRNIVYTQNKIRGNSGIFIIEEFAYWDDKKAENLLDEISPVLTQKNGYDRVIICSSASWRYCEFFNLYYGTNAKHFICMKYTLDTAIAQKWEDYCIGINKIKDNLGLKRFDTEYKGIFYPKDTKSTVLNIRMTEEEKDTLTSKAQEMGFNTISDFAKASLSNVCRSHLFFIDTGDKTNDIRLTSLVRHIDFDENKITITAILDEENTMKKYLDLRYDIKIWWLNKKGEKIDYVYSKYKTFKFYPISFSNVDVDVLYGKFTLDTSS